MSKKAIRDTIFFDPQRALKISRKQNRLTHCEKPLKWSIFIQEIDTQKRQEFYNDLQICYYLGEKLFSKNIPKNCIHLSVENIFEFFKVSRLRYPEVIDFKNIPISKIEKQDFQNYFSKILENLSTYKTYHTIEYTNIIKQNKLNFKEPLRFFLMANRHTTVMKVVSENISKALTQLGYEVCLSLENNNMEALTKYLHFQEWAKFKPHVVIAINGLNNEYLHKDVFHFSWYQDPMPEIVEEKKLSLRKRDFIYSLVPLIDMYLKRNDYPFERQSFCINPEIFKTNKTIKRIKNKIVFIGSAYYPQVPEFLRDCDLFHLLKDMYLAGEPFTETIITEISLNYSVKIEFIFAHMIPYVVRDVSVIEMCNTLSDKYILEVYGWGWDIYESVKPYFKGSLNYGEELSNVYHEAKYTLAPHGNGIMQQRVLEAASCGCIPIVYDCRYIDILSPSFEDNLIYFQKIKDIESLLSQKKKYKLKELVKKHSYNTLAKNIIHKIENTLITDNGV